VLVMPEFSLCSFARQEADGEHGEVVALFGIANEAGYSLCHLCDEGLRGVQSCQPAGKGAKFFHPDES